MQTATRFPVAIHILLLAEFMKDSRKITSDFISGSVNTNPVVIRRIMGLLGKAGLIETLPGTGGTRLSRPPEKITLLDVYRACEPDDSGKILRIHTDTAQACLVGGNIFALLDPYFGKAQRAMENELGRMTLADLLRDLSGMVGRPARPSRGMGRPADGSGRAESPGRRRG